MIMTYALSVRAWGTLLDKRRPGSMSSIVTTKNVDTVGERLELLIGKKRKKRV